MTLSLHKFKVLFGELVQETYWLHKCDGKSVCMWVEQNNNLMFYYQEIGVEVDGGLIGQNMFFILSIQTLWQKEMMVELGHQGVVVGDVSFGTNDKKVIHMV